MSNNYILDDDVSLLNTYGEYSDILESLNKQEEVSNNEAVRGIVSLFNRGKPDEKIEMAATDGNRLCRCIKDVSASVEKAMRIVIPSKTMNELGRIFSITEDKKFQMKIANNNYIYFRQFYVVIKSS